MLLTNLKLVTFGHSWIDNSCFRVRVCLKIAGMAQAFNIPIDNGGAWPFHNMHLHAGVANGGMVEYHYVAVQMLRQIFNDLPEPKDGWMTLSERPGLGFAPDPERVKELAKRPLSGGKGKA